MIYLIRHGESEANVDFQILKDRPDCGIKLTSKGLKQATDLNKWLADKFGKTPLVVLHSPYVRTRQTMNTACFGNSMSFKSLNVVSLKEELCLTEIRFGLLEGLTTNEFLNRYPDAYWNFQKALKDPTGSFYASRPQGESYFDVCMRVRHLVGDLLKAPKELPILIFAHGGTNRCLQKELLKESVEYFVGLENQENCSVIEIDSENETSELLWTPSN